MAEGAQPTGGESADVESRRLGDLDRQLNRRYTANFMAFADIAIVLVCLPTIYKTDGLDFGRLSSQVALGASAILTAHAVLLFWLGGVLARFLIGVATEGSAALGDRRAELFGESRFRERVDRHLRALPGLSNAGWYALVGIGLLPQVVFVVQTGGMDKSPFAQILVATFILGQFRASTGKAIWGLFAVGIITAFATHVLYLRVVRDVPDLVFTETFEARTFIAPGVLVAFASTLIYWITFRLEQRERTISDEGVVGM